MFFNYRCYIEPDLLRLEAFSVYAYQAYNHYGLNNSLIIHNPDPKLSIAENILYMLRPDSSYTEAEARILDLALVLHAEHGGGNNSTFTTHVVTSSGTDTYSTMAAALSSLKGHRHGGANIKVVQMFEDMKKTLKNWEDEEEIANMTFNKIISAIKLKDNSKIVDMFSCTIQEENDLLQDVSSFSEFIQGDIISFSSASDAGVGTDYRIENGRKIKEIQSTFSIKTTQSIYYIAIRECIADGFDSKNVGVHSIYIIESKDWTEDYIYRGDGKWTPGINIGDK